MAPPPAPRVVPRVARAAARYRPGKAPLGASAEDFSDSDQDTSHNDAQAAHPPASADLSSGAAALLASQSAGRKTAGIVLNEAGPSTKKLDLRLHTSTKQEEEEGSSEYETDTDPESAAVAKPVFRKPGAPAPPPAEEEGSSEYETDSSEEESEQEAPKPLLKPIFVPKSARSTIAKTEVEPSQAEEDPEAKAAAEAQRRRKEAHDLAAATIQRSLLQTQHESTQSTEVDDTDGLDPEAEFAAWRERELARLRRDQDALLAKQAEQREIEEFKSLPESEKERLGRERAAKLKTEKMEQRGERGFLQKYYHKGSFFQDMDILKRDYSEKTEKEVDVSKLPKMMQKRGWGEKGRGKWTHLANEDTSTSAIRLDVMGAGGKGDRSGCFVCGGDHLKRDCPKRDRGEGGEGSGANRAEVASGSRSWGEAKENNGDKRERKTRERSRSPKRDSRGYEDEREPRASSSRSRHHDDKDSRSHRSREDRDREHDRESRRHRDKKDDYRHRSHQSHRDDDDDQRSKSDRHQDTDDRKHRSRHHKDDQDREKERYKRRDREREGDHDREHRHSSSSSSSRKHGQEESDRKRSRLDT
ncbi:hypothetical protein NDA14_000922 [Ustilago hordei]|nr:hypothetical protein NDA10_006384 [Ustilago hordei]KAJ1575072.1 hypothetical protein NDA15_006558 [Ustilago hordei]KAJ1594058.1 hypothetical protein NDA12_004622 [Ustilago hordei]KAJ1597473.1 hypothetical protein NDA14_000922 [Ustilago hordei]UTT88658.1 hypothetical protein NDA17_002089 [Ustilago hordei]